MKIGFEKIFIVVFLAILLLISVVNAEENFIVKLGENKTFTEFNLHEAWFSNGDFTAYPFPDDKFVESSGSQIKGRMYATPCTHGQAMANIGVRFTYDLKNYSWDDVKDLPLAVSIDGNYSITAGKIISNPMVTSGNAFVFLLTDHLLDGVIDPPPHSVDPKPGIDCLDFVGQWTSNEQYGQKSTEFSKTFYQTRISDDDPRMVPINISNSQSQIIVGLDSAAHSDCDNDGDGPDSYANGSLSLHSISIEFPLYALFKTNVTDGLVPLAVQFNGTPIGDPISWQWDFGDGTYSTEQNPIHTYTHCGNFTISLTVGNGAEINTTQKIDFITVTSGTTGIVSFDQGEYTDLKSCARISLIDPDLNTNSALPETITLQVSSRDTVTGESWEIPVTLTEISPDSSTFNGVITFDTTASDAEKGSIRVSATYPGIFWLSYHDEHDDSGNAQDRSASANYQFFGTIEGQAFERVAKGGGRFELQGIDGAEVWITPEGSGAALDLGITTNEIGQFTINNVATGKYRVDIRWGEPGATSKSDSQQVEVFSGKSTYVFFPSDYFKQMKASAAKDASTSYDELREEWERIDYTMNLLDKGQSLMTIPISITQTISGWDSLSNAYTTAKYGPHPDPILAEALLTRIKGELVMSVAEQIIDPKEAAIRGVITLFDKIHENIIQKLKEYKEDPPDMNYQEKVIPVIPETVVAPPEYTSNLTGYNLMDPYIDLVNDLNYQIVIDAALLTSFERYQGAFLDNQPEFMVMQLEQVEYYSNVSAYTSEEIVEDIHILKPELMNMETEYGIILRDIKQNLSESGFSPDEVAYLQTLGCEGGNVDDFKQYLEFENLSGTSNYLNTLETTATARAANMHNLSVQAREVLIQLNYPVADFTATRKSGYSPLFVQFNDTSYGNPETWNWSFGDGNFSESKDPVNTYSSVGTYNVTLHVTNSEGGNSTVKSNYITVLPAPSPSPSITSITPVTGANSASVSITDLTGTNFTSGADVMLTPVIANPLHKGSITSGAGSGVFVSGNYAYVAGGNGLEIVEVSDPANPVHTGNLPEGGGQSVFVSGNYAYVAGQSKLEIVDVSDPANPVHKGSIADGDGGAHLSSPFSVYVSGDYAYVIDFSYDALEIVDVSNPAEPLHKSSITLNNARIVSVSGTHAYVLGSVGTFFVVDISYPAEPVVKYSGYLLDEWSSNLYVSGKYAYVAKSGGHSLVIIDVTDPANPVQKGAIGDGEGGAFIKSPYSVYVSGNYAYVADRKGALEIVDVTDPAYPVHKGSIQNGTGGAILVSPNSVSVSGNHAYVTGSNALEIIDIGTVTATDVQVVSPTAITGSFDLTGKPAGDYTVVVTNPDGQFGTLPGGFAITADSVDPVAAFTSDVTSGNAPFSVRFNDTSTGNPTMWNWSFGDEQWFNTTDVAVRNATHVYQNAGAYTVNLTVTNGAGSDTESKTDFITVISAVPPVPGYTNPPTDPDFDGLFEDLNANGFADWDDAVVLFWNTDWIQDNEPLAAFDFNHNGFIDWDDAVVLFWEV